HLALALAATAQAIAEESAAEPADPNANPDIETEPEPEAPQTMSLFSLEGPGPRAQGPASESEQYSGGSALDPGTLDPACVLGLSVTPSHALAVALDTPGLREALADPKLPKQVHDLKAVLRALEPHNVTLGGNITDVMLQSYLLNPTHGSHTLID